MAACSSHLPQCDWADYIAGRRAFFGARAAGVEKSLAARAGRDLIESPEFFAAGGKSPRAGTNPEELIAAAHAGCYSMALSFYLEQAGFPPTSIRTQALVQLGATAAGPTITRIELSTEAVVEGIVEAEFHERAETARQGCLISRALAGVAVISLKSRLVRDASTGEQE